MGSFYVNGFHSQLDLEWDDKAFLLLGVFCHPPYDFKPDEKEYIRSRNKYIGNIEPIAFPIFCEYFDYGQVYNIIRDDNVRKIEEKLDDSIENILELIKEVREDRILTKEQANKYIRYREKLGLTSYNFEEGWDKLSDKAKLNYPLEMWIEHNKNNEYNYELTWTIDHAWVYETLGKTYLEEVKKSYPPSDFYTGFLSDPDRYIYTREELEKHKEEYLKFLSFKRYLNFNGSNITQSYPSGQEFHWDKIKMYAEEYSKFIKSKIK